MKRTLPIFIFLTLFLFLEADVFGQLRSRSRQIRAQNKRISNYKGGLAGGFGNKKYNSVSFTINALNYFGDLAPKSQIASTDISFTRPGIGVAFDRKMGARYSVRANLLYGRIQGSDFQSADPNDDLARYRYVRNLQFRNDIIEFSVQGVVDITPNYSTFLGRARLTPYVFAGIAGFYHNPKALVPDTDVNTGQPLAEAGTWVALEPLGTEGQYTAGSGVNTYSKIQLAIPFGGGLKYKLNQSFDITLEVGYRYLFFDHIDDVSGSYVDLPTLDSDLARVMSDRSREATDVISGQARDFSNPQIAEIVSRTDPNGLIRGYGSSAGGSNIRGNNNDNDIYIVTSIKVTYILGSSIFAQAKYR